MGGKGLFLKKLFEGRIILDKKTPNHKLLVSSTDSIYSSVSYLKFIVIVQKVMNSKENILFQQP